MAAVQGGLFGLGASGQIAGTLVYSKWKGRPYVRILATPSNPRSGGQVGVRAMMKYLTQTFNQLTPASFTSYQPLADASNITLLNAVVQFNMRRWTQFNAPALVYPGGADTIPVLGALTVTAGVHQVTVSQALTTLNDGWGFMVFRSSQTGFTPARDNCVAVVFDVVTPLLYVDTGVPSGTWYYRTIGFSEGGNKTAAVAEQAAVVA